MYNLEGKIGGDAELSPRGEMYAKKLPALVLESVGVCTTHPNQVPQLIYIG
jgi:hypothetical protein